MIVACVATGRCCNTFAETMLLLSSELCGTFMVAGRWLFSVVSGWGSVIGGRGQRSLIHELV